MGYVCHSYIYILNYLHTNKSWVINVIPNFNNIFNFFLSFQSNYRYLKDKIYSNHLNIIYIFIDLTFLFPKRSFI
jgi:hypothetical protein